MLCSVSRGWSTSDLVPGAPVVTPLMLNSAFIDAALWITSCSAVLPSKNLGLRLCTSISGCQQEGWRAGGTSSGTLAAWHSWMEKHRAPPARDSPAREILATAKSEGYARGRALQRTSGSCYNWKKVFLLPPIVDCNLDCPSKTMSCYGEV